jgi:hypothetical protein
MRITTIRIPYDLEAAVKEAAQLRGRPWQTVLKELLAESLGLELEPSSTEVKRIPSTALHAAAKRLRRKH